MPMDNNENYYPGLSEQNPKVTSILLPYGLSKFDFDCTPTIFDSLVEGEVFFGISSREDNCWIEDFSRGNSGIEFSSTATDSCPIPRRVDVWSEATSSESVEMLLKSVGQEEMLPGESIPEASDACDELGTLAKQMELNSRQGGNRNDQDSNGELQLVQPSDNSFLLIQGSASIDISSKCASLTQVKHTEIGWSVVNLERSSLVSSERSSQVEGNFDEINQPKAGTFLNGPSNYSMGENVVLQRQRSSYFSYVIEDDGFTNGRDSSKAEPLENASTEAENVEGVGEASTQKNYSSADNVSVSRIHPDIHSSISELPISVDSNVEGKQNFEDLSGIPGREESSLPTNVNSQDLHPVVEYHQDSEGFELPGSMEIKRSTEKRENSPRESEGDLRVDKQAFESSEVKFHRIDVDCERQEDSPFPMSRVESSTELEESSLGSHSPVGKGASATTSERNVHGVQPEHGKLIAEDEINFVDTLPILADVSQSVQSVAEHNDLDNLVTEDQVNYVDDLPILAYASQSLAKHTAQSRNERDGAAESHEDTDLFSVSLPTAVPAGAASSDKFNVLNQDTANEKQDSGNVGSNAVVLYNDAARLSSFSLDEGVKGKLGMEHNSGSQKPCSIGPDTILPAETNIGCIGSNAASQETYHNTSPSSASHDTADEIVEDKGAGVKSETEAPSVKVPSEIEIDTGTVALAERILCRNVSVGEVIRGASSLPLMKTHDSAAMDEGVVFRPKEILEYPNKIDVDYVPGDSEVGEAEGGGAVAVAERKGTKTESNYIAASLEVSDGGNLAEADTRSHGTSSVHSCSKLPEPDASMKESHLDSVDRHVSDRTWKAGEMPLKPKIDRRADDGSREEMSFSFDVPPVVVGMHVEESGINRQLFHSVTTCKMPKGKKESYSTPSCSQKDHKDGKKVSQVTIKATEGVNASAGSKSTSERKTRRSSTKYTKTNVKKGNSVVQTEGGRSCGALGSHSGPDRLFQFDVGITESSGTKLTATPIPTSHVPDLNTSVSTSALFNQPLSDLQQVQLRAQIFVYGSLIQGAIPDEACMVSAFGTSEGGRTLWEPKWRACAERLHYQPISNYNTPVQSPSGSKVQNKSSKQSIPQSKAVPSPTTLLTTKNTPSTPIKVMIPLSSPLWNLPTPSCGGLPSRNVVREGALQAFPPLHPCQTPPARTFGGMTASWFSPAPVPGPWISSSRTSAFDSSACLSSSPSTETVKLNPLNSAFLAPSTSVMFASDTPLSHSSTSSNLGQGSSMEMLTSPRAQNSAASKSRKRKKSNTTVESPQYSLSTTFTGSIPYPGTSQYPKDGPPGVCLGSMPSPAATPLIGSHFSTSVAITASPVMSIDPIQKGELLMEKSSAHKCDLKQLEEAKLAGKEAVAHEADVVSRCQSIWSVLEEQRNSRLDPDTEAQLSSSAAALAAAASVAKAAAAAAKLACSAALHFHQFAIKALTGNGDPAQNGPSTVSDAADNLHDAPPASIFGGGIENHTRNVIKTAGEAAWSKVEVSVASFEHAENLDAVVNAAELAAKAVLQAGRVVAMGKPLPLSALVEAGPENYWRGDAQLVKCSVEKGDEKNIRNSKEMCKQSEGPSDLEVCTMMDGSAVSKDIVKNVEKNIRLDEEGLSVAHIFGDKGITAMEDSPAHGHTTGAGGVVSDSALEGNVPVQNADVIAAKTLKDGSITENCTVEVFKDGGSFKGAWFLAKVLSLNDEKALVCYTDLQVGEESDSLREWVPLEGEKKEIPIMRLARPMPGVHLEGTRKRCRAALTEYHWSVGDRVDAWTGDCWREGDITEQNKNDPTIFSVHFPDAGETSIVKAWDLRPTFTWKNGKWIELLTSRQSVPSQGDTPREKRLRLASPSELKGKREFSKNINDLGTGKVDESNLLPLSSTDKLLDMGINRGENKANAPRMMRSGLQKEGSKFFGVPKPGKRKKFMDVSKHYVSEGSTKNDVPTNSSKLSKFLMPQGSESFGFKNSSEVDLKDKQDIKPKLKASKTGKLPDLLGRALPQKENSTPAVSEPHETMRRRHIVKDPTNNNGKGSCWQNKIRSHQGSNHEAGFDVPVSTQTLSSDSDKVSKNINSNQRMKGKPDVAGARMKKAGAEDKLIPDLTGPRRSHRRIQPTSRLLEGLQSSFMTLKIPSASHDRSHRVQPKGASRGTNSHG